MKRDTPPAPRAKPVLASKGYSFGTASPQASSADAESGVGPARSLGNEALRVAQCCAVLSPSAALCPFSEFVRGKTEAQLTLLPASPRAQREIEGRSWDSTSGVPAVVSSNPEECSFSVWLRAERRVSGARPFSSAAVWCW